MTIQDFVDYCNREGIPYNTPIKFADPEGEVDDFSPNFFDRSPDGELVLNSAENLKSWREKRSRSTSLDSAQPTNRPLTAQASGDQLQRASEPPHKTAAPVDAAKRDENTTPRVVSDKEKEKK